jgi:uncharacterized protein YfaS (alpha-2-macroglobulin family)
MKKFLPALLGFALLIGLLPLPPAEGASQNGVASFSPSGTVADNTAFKIVFDEDVVTQNETGKALPASDFPFVTTPPIQAEGKWLDRRTFSASLLAPLEMATRYSVTVREGLKSRNGRALGEGANFTFQTAPLQLLNAAAAGTGSEGVSVRLDFNMPVSPSRLKGFLSIAANSQKKNYWLASGPAMKTIHVTVPVEDFDKTLSLRVGLSAGLTGETGTLGLPQDEVRNFTITPTLRIESVTAFSEYNDSVLRVATNLEIDVEAARAGGFVKVEPETSFSIDSSYYGGVFYVRGAFNPRERSVFTFKKGLPSKKGGITLAEDVVQAVIMPDLPPSINFAAPGTFLSPTGGGRVPVELVNVRKLDLNLWRLYENNLPYVTRGDYSNFDRSLARRAAGRTLDLSLPLNKKVRRVIALDDLLSGDRGLFLLTLADREAEYWDERSQIVNLSDIGMIARLWEDGILIWANTLSALEPIGNADVRVYSAAGQVLAEGKTGADGVWQSRRNEPWSGEDSAPSLAVVSRGRETAYVRLTRGLLSQETFDTAGRPWLRSGYDAALFSARDIYRTGERAVFKAVVRNHDLSTPEPFPVLFVARDPLARAAKRGTALLSKEGGALFDFDIPGGAMTGLWQIYLYTPGDEGRSRPLAWMDFHVEDFAPPRIEVALSADAEWPEPNDEVTLGVSARYLFGADGAGLKWEAEWRAREGVFKPKETWAAYTFGDPARKFAPQSEPFGSGTLGPEGNAQGSFTLPSDWEAPSVVDLTLVGRVMEEGGRWVEKRAALTFCPYPFLIGVAAPGGTQAVGRDAVFRVAAVAPGGDGADEELAGAEELVATLYRVTWNYNLVEVDGYTRWQSSEEYSRVEEKSVALAGGTGEVSFTPRRWGTYVLRVRDAEDNARTSVRFYADDPEYAGQDGSQLLDRVEITTDRESYKVGDVAKVTLRAPFEGLLLFNVEAAGPIRRDILKVDKAGTVLEVPVTEEMLPNAWCAAWLIRPVAEGEAWGTHRAIGVKRLNVDTGDFRLNVGLDAPAKCDPAAKISVTLSLKDSQGNPVGGEAALALVDDGVLGLTDFETPDLLNHFLAPRAINSDGYDIYDQLMPLEARGTELLHPAGGVAEKMAAFAAALKSQRFKILSLFDGTLVADGNDGIVKAELDLPEFSGRGRLFAVAVSGSRFGTAERTIQIARDIVTEADLPRFAAPGDTFFVPVTVFNSSAEMKDVTVELSAEGELAVAERRLTGSVPANGSRKWTVTFRALGPGAAAYNVKTLWDGNGSEGKSYEQRIEMPVRSPFPAVTLSGSGIFGSGDAEVDIRALENLAGPVSGKLVFSGTPVVDLSRAVNFLAHYPYGCLEQTLSAAWPFLILPDAISEIDPLLVRSDLVRRKTDFAIARLQTMQLYDGSFAKWPGDARPYNWGSVYAAHFLAEARRAGIDYPEEMLAAAIGWLKQFIASLPSSSLSSSSSSPSLSPDDFEEARRYGETHDMTTKAYAAYVLALYGEKPLGWLHYLKENEQRMWPSGRIWLAGAYALLEGRADALRNLGEGGGVWDDAVPEAAALRETLDSAVRNTAQLLSLWVEVEPRAPEAARLVQRLLAWGRENRWYGTQENAAVATALGRYLLKAGREKSALEGVLADGDRPILAFRSGERAAIDLRDLPEKPSLRIRAVGTGSGYYSWAATGTPSRAPEPARRGLSVECFWTDREGTSFPEGAPFAQGTEVVVTLRIAPGVSVDDVAVSCLLPAGMEIENPRLTDGDAPQAPGVRYDIRDDRLLLFIDRLSRVTDYRFVMRAVTRGIFTRPPLSAEGMYDPGVRFVGEAEESIIIK